ncbi:transporter substrate-binding domain-containing protein [Mesorhizobium sp. LjRoot246]|uniref:transporter substrate-binding domain-containing protein n=1 Tax=Mesorhizobium sp. LjRoot246 TaxID=3342294 RepID=UPI003ECF24B4
MKYTTRLAVVLVVLVAAYPAFAKDKKITEVLIATEGGYQPWNYTKPDGTIAGFEIDLANDLCSRMKVKCTFTAQSFDSMIPALNAGKFDAIMDSLTITPKREEVIGFSAPYGSLCYTFATSNSDIESKLKPDDSIISLDNEPATKSALDLLKAAFTDKTIGTLAGGGSVAFVDTYLKGSTLMRQYKTPEARDLDLAAGRLDVIIGTKDQLVDLVKKPGNESVKVVGPCFQGGLLGKGVGVGVRKEDTNLKALFDKAIAEAKKDGTIKKLSVPVFGVDLTPQ